MCPCICLGHLPQIIVNLLLNIIILWIITVKSNNFPIIALYRIDVTIVTLNSISVWTTTVDIVNIFTIVIQKHCVYWEVRSELFKELFSRISEFKNTKFKITFIWKRNWRLIIEWLCLYSVGAIHGAEGAVIEDWQEKNNLRMSTETLQN